MANLKGTLKGTDVHHQVTYLDVRFGSLLLFCMLFRLEVSAVRLGEVSDKYPRHIHVSTQIRE